MANPVSKALLVILDGYGLAENPEVSAIDKAQKPFIDSLFENYPHSTLSASGKDSGLPEGQFGNSEVGHLNIGAGRIVPQELTRINNAIEDGSFFSNDVLTTAFEKAKQKDSRIHIMGLFSDGGVHSHNNHLFALLKFAKKTGIENTYIHAFTDGRDTSPHGGIGYVEEFQKQADKIGTGKIASIVGRYYAMDRDERWARTKLAYDLLVYGEGEQFDNPLKALKASYDEDVTDEFVKPKLIDSSPESRIQKDDVIIFYNIRGDRARQITRALTEKNFDKFEVEQLNLHYNTFTSYDDDFKQVNVAYPPLNLPNTLGEIISDHGLKQLRIAETEKYPHVTYFFNGGEEDPFEGEERMLIPSPKVATYDMQPEMSAPQVTDKLCDQLATEKYHLCILNYANPDMVGHTGDMQATIKAVETIDQQLERVIETATEHSYKILIIADHGNADCLINEDGSPHTAHTSALVPALILNEAVQKKMKDGILADVAPTLLKMMGIQQPKEMTGTPLF